MWTLEKVFWLSQECTTRIPSRGGREMSVCGLEPSNVYLYDKECINALRTMMGLSQKTLIKSVSFSFLYGTLVSCRKSAYKNCHDANGSIILSLIGAHQSGSEWQQHLLGLCKPESWTKSSRFGPNLNWVQAATNRFKWEAGFLELSRVNGRTKDPIGPDQI